MEGYSDLPFRSLCRKLGSAMSYTEFIHALEVIQGNSRLVQKLAYLPEERPVVYQLYDNDPGRLLEAALRLEALEPDIIDINMGCSVRRISGRGAGAGLLCAPLTVARIFRQLSHALSIPVTAKIRLGWDETSRNHILISRIVEENGGALIAVHGRTRNQGYGGKVDWDAIAEVKSAVSIPVIANGDIRTVADIEKVRSHTACDGVMIGRAAIGNPWIFSRLDREKIPLETVRKTMNRHLEGMLKFYGKDQGMIRFRKHATRYLGLESLSRERRTRILTINSPGDYLEALDIVMR